VHLLKNADGLCLASHGCVAHAEVEERAAEFRGEACERAARREAGYETVSACQEEESESRGRQTETAGQEKVGVNDNQKGHTKNGRTDAREWEVQG
jgi:hypothetical protein